MTDDTDLLNSATLGDIAQIALDHYPLAEQMDWDDLFDRAEHKLDLELASDMGSRQAQQIKRHVRRVRREARDDQ